MLADTVIFERMAKRIRETRLKQNITQQSLAQEAGVSLSTLKNIEKGEIGSFDSLLRLLRTLGLLEVLLPLIEEERLSPNEYYQMVQSSSNHQRKRASGKIKMNNKETAEW